MKKITHLLTENEALDKVLKASNKVSHAVATTLGPKGRNVIVRKYHHKPFVTHDGVTVARSLELNDPLEDTVAELLREGATAMESLTGDATTTVTILTDELIREGARMIKAGENPMTVKKKLEEYAEGAVASLEKQTKKRVTKKDLINVATISAGDEKIGKEIGDAIFNAGKDTPVILNFSESSKTTIELIDGVRIPSGTASPYLLENGASKEEVEEPLIAIVDATLRDKDDVIPILRAIATLPPEQKKILIIATDVAGDALGLLIANKVNKFAGISVVRVPEAIKAPSQYLADLAITVGAKVLARNTGDTIDNASTAHFGFANKVIVNHLETLIIGGRSVKEDLDGARANLQKVAKEGKTLAERDFAKQRLNTLSQQLLSIHVGGQSQTEAEEKHFRYEDAIGAARAAARGGILPGGGSALYKAANDVNFVGYTMPVFWLLESINQSKDAGIAQQYRAGKIIDVMHPELGFVDPYERGIVDPAESEIEAVKTATSIAGLLLTSAVMIVEEAVADDNQSE